MATVKAFEDLQIWQESMQQVCEIYSLLTNCKDYGFKDQIQRAAVSVPSNISEGFERYSNKEFIQFLSYAKGSCGELRTQLYIANHLNYIEKSKGEELIKKAKDLSSKIAKLITYRKNYNS